MLRLHPEAAPAPPPRSPPITPAHPRSLLPRPAPPCPPPTRLLTGSWTAGSRWQGPEGPRWRSPAQDRQRISKRGRRGRHRRSRKRLEKAALCFSCVRLQRRRRRAAAACCQARCALAAAARLKLFSLSPRRSVSRPAPNVQLACHPQASQHAAAPGPVPPTQPRWPSRVPRRVRVCRARGMGGGRVAALSSCGFA